MCQQGCSLVCCWGFGLIYWSDTSILPSPMHPSRSGATEEGISLAKKIDVNWWEYKLLHSKSYELVWRFVSRPKREELVQWRFINDSSLKGLQLKSSTPIASELKFKAQGVDDLLLLLVTTFSRCFDMMLQFLADQVNLSLNVLLRWH